ncbi:MAG: M20/M25/M40 family metallo-hydrolase [Bryobacteraceae bacterium]|nr:M20/M25/M40 family metallo-hydrolase [Bryobacteraceae bacterium]
MAKQQQLAALSPRALAELPAIRNAGQWFARERQWIQDRHLKLCRIAAPTFFEEKRAAWIAEQLLALGWEAKTDRAGNVIATRSGEEDRPAVALTAHLDTVLAPRSPEEIRQNPDGSLHGPGVSDNGAGLAGLLAIAAAASRFSLFEETPGRLMLIANVGEEGEGNLSGMRYLCRPGGPRIQAFVVLDGPATDHITCRALASRRFDVSLNGPGGHSWSDHGAANPVHALSRAITLYCDNRRSANGTCRSSYNFGVIDGGSSITSIPASARAKVDLRSESPETLDELTAALSAAVEQALEVENARAAGARLSARIKELGSRPAGRLSDNSPLLRHLLAVDQHLGIRSQTDCSSTDANIPLSLGVPAVSIGAGGQGGGAHTTEEWFHAEGRELGLRRVLMLLSLLTRDPEILSH